MTVVLSNRMLDIDEVAEITKLPPSSIERQVRCGEFPKQRLLSARRTAWLASDVLAWMESRPESDLPPPPNTGAKKPRRAGAAAPAAPASHQEQ